MPQPPTQFEQQGAVRRRVSGQAERYQDATHVLKLAPLDLQAGKYRIASVGRRKKSTGKLEYQMSPGSCQVPLKTEK